MSDFNDVGDFHQKFGLNTSSEGLPRELPQDVVEFRLKFLLEELTEIADGYGYELKSTLTPIRQSSPQRQDLVKVADGLVDLVYVALGTAHLHQLPWPALFAEVQRANMSKERAVHSDDARSVRKHSLDVVKPAGFRPPNIIEVLMAAGWQGPVLPIGEE